MFVRCPKPLVLPCGGVFRTVLTGLTVLTADRIDTADFLEGRPISSTMPTSPTCQLRPLSTLSETASVRKHSGELLTMAGTKTYAMNARWMARCLRLEADLNLQPALTISIQAGAFIDQTFLPHLIKDLLAVESQFPSVN